MCCIGPKVDITDILSPVAGNKHLVSEYALMAALLARAPRRMGCVSTCINEG